MKKSNAAGDFLPSGCFGRFEDDPGQTRRGSTRFGEGVDAVLRPHGAFDGVSCQHE